MNAKSVLRLRSLLLAAALPLALASSAWSQYTLHWSDECNNTTAGSAPNAAYWTYDLGNNFGNGELDYATDSRTNSYYDGNGNLVVVLRNDPTATPQYTSAHLKTEGLVPVGPYGQVEANIRIPYSTGIGGAFWALGWNYPQVGWPACGEIDIMESHGSNTNDPTAGSRNNGTIHGINYADYGISTPITINGNLTDAFHRYGMYWAPYSIKFYLDNTTYANLDISGMACNENWPFNAPIYVIDSYGVGGIVSGPPDSTTVWPQYAYTDYVRWYTYTAGVPAAPTNLTGSANSNSVTLNWGASSTAGATYDVYINTTNSFAAGDLNTLEEYNVSGTTFTAYNLQPSTTYYFQVRAQNPGGESAATNTFTVTTSARGNGGPVYINCGGYGVGNYMRDLDFTPTGNPSNAPQITMNLAGLTNPAPNNVYQTIRWNPSNYAINNLDANRLYTVRLHFVENQWNAVGARLFNVYLNGNPVLTNFDIYAAAGDHLNTPVIYTYTAMSDASGNIQVDTQNGPRDAASISAIDIVPNNGANTLPATPAGLTANGISTNQITVSWAAANGATSYNLFRSQSPNFVPSSATFAANGITGTSYTDNVLYTGTTYYYKVAAVNSTGQGQASAQASAATQASSDGTIGALNAGGTTNGIFASDQGYGGQGSNNNNFAPNPIDTSLLTGAIPAQTVLQTDREGNFNYTFSNLQNGRPVTVTMYFIEGYFTAAGSRIFDVTINGTKVLSNFDIYVAAGNARFKAVQRSADTMVDAQGKITIQLTPSKDNAAVSAIVLSQGPNPPITIPTIAATTLATHSNMLTWTPDNTVIGYTVYRGTSSGGETQVATNVTGTTYLDTGLTDGTKYYYQMTSTNWSGTSGKSNEVSATPNPWPVPGKIEMENYNTGGEGVAYHTTATSNLGGAYRLTENVALEPCSDTGGGYDLCYESSGQWVNYTVNVAQAGLYTVTFRTASFGSGAFHLEDASGNNLTGSLTPANTGGWQVWADVTTTISLPAGVQTLKYVEDGSDYNVNYMTFTYSGPPQAPAAPTGLLATASSGSVVLNWTASSGAMTYNVYRGTTANGESTTPIATGLTTTAYTDNTVTNGTTYYYKVAAVNTYGTSGYSNEVSATPSAAAAPTVQLNCGGAASGSFTADAGFSGGGSTTWGNAIDTSLLTGTVPPQAVLQSDREGTFTYTLTGFTAGSSQSVTLYFVENYFTTAGSRVFSVTANGTTVISNLDVYAAAGATFKAIQRSFNATANSSGQIVLQFTPTADQAKVGAIVVTSGTGGGGSAPAAPTGLSATAGNASVALSWTASSGATSYNVYRGTTAGGESTTALATGITTTTYTDATAANGTTYYYEVAAVNSYGTSALSNEASATPSSGSGGTVLAAINCGGAASGSFTADAGATGGGSVSWASTVDTSLLTGTIPPQAVLQCDHEGMSTYTLTGFTAGATESVTLYFVENYFTTTGSRVFSVAANGTTVISNLDVYAAAGAKFKAIQRTFNVTASSSGQIVLQFTATADQAKVGAIVVTSGSGGGGSAPAAPTGLTATAGNASVALSWTASSGATSYNVYRGTTAGGESTTALATGITSASYTDATAANGTTYYYEVAAVNSYGTSALSNEASATPSAGSTAVASINCGGTASGSFVADTGFSGGGTVSWANTVDTSLLTGTIPPQAVLQCDREGAFSYTITGLTAGSSHTVTLYFAENYWSTTGSRVFSVTANGAAALTNFDVYAAAGAKFKAVQRSFTVTASASGQIVLQFTATADQAKCGAIVVN